MKALLLFPFVVLMPAIAGCHSTHGDGAYASDSGRGDKEIQTPTGPMVLIPAGEFTMGTTSEQEQWLRDKGWWHDWMAIEQPAATVYLDAYYIDKYEVTNAQYGEFMKITGRSAPLYWNDSKYNQPDQPVVGVTYDDAEAYCDWHRSDCPLRRSGRRQRAARMAGISFGATMHRLVNTLCGMMETIAGVACTGPGPWDPSRRESAPMASMTWLGMHGSGSTAGSTRRVDLG